MLPRCDTLIDVGCDHGLLCLQALESGSAARAAAVDISEASLDKARRALIPSFGDRTVFLLRDGIAGLDVSSFGRYAVALCGMGGELIASILKSGADVARGASRLVMQPMGGERELRAWLCANGFAVRDENTVFDAGRYYQLIGAVFAPGEAAPYAHDAFLEFGAIAFAKRQEALRALAQRTFNGRRARMDRAREKGLMPPSLARDLAAAQYIIEHWEDKI